MRGNTNMYQYYKTVCESFQEDTMALLLVKAVVWLNSWLEEYGAGLSKPIAIISEDVESIVRIEKELRGFTQNQMEFITLSPKKIETSLQNSSYGIAFFKFQEGRYTVDNLVQIGNACGKMIADIGKRKTAIVFAEKGIPDKYTGYFSGYVYISSTGRRNVKNTQEYAQQFLRDLIEYVLKKQDTFMNMLKDTKMQAFDMAGQVIKALIDEDILMGKHAERYRKEIDTCIEKVKNEWNCPSNSAAICDSFCKTLYNVSKTLALKMYSRKSIPGMSEKEMMRLVYYDKEYYYMSDEVFSKICELMDVPYGAKYIMAQLINEGMLVRNGVSRSYNTVHTELVSVYGTIRVRMVKLLRSSIDWKADFSLQEILEDKMDGNPEERGIVLGWSANSGNIVKLAGDIMNNSILISGKSGSGKTCALNILSRRIVEQGGTVLVLSYNDTFTKIEDTKEIRRIKVMSQGLPVALLSPVCKADNSVEEEKDLITAAIEILCNVVHLHAKQKRRLREAVKQAVRDKSGANDIQKLKDALQGADEVSKTLYEDYQGLFDNVRNNPEMNLFENGKITILDFSGYPSVTQRFLAELVLSVIWRQFRVTGVDRKKTLYVVCDEFQMLSVKQNAALDQMLREGRKYHVAVMLATQTLVSFDTSVRAIVQQAATQLYFRPSEGEIKSVCRYIDANASDKWVPEIQSLQIGECVALGRFQINRSTIERPLKISFRARNIDGRRNKRYDKQSTDLV